MRHIAATSHLVCTAAATRLLALILSLRSVARIQTSLNSCDRSQRQNWYSVAATKILTSHEAICWSNLSRRRVAAICCIVCLGLETNVKFWKKKRKKFVLSIYWKSGCYENVKWLGETVNPSKFPWQRNKQPTNSFHLTRQIPFPNCGNTPGDGVHSLPFGSMRTS